MNGNVILTEQQVVQTMRKPKGFRSVLCFNVLIDIRGSLDFSYSLWKVLAPLQSVILITAKMVLLSIT